MHLLESVHPVTPGRVLRLFYSYKAAEDEAVSLIRMIGDTLVESVVDHEIEERWDRLVSEGQPLAVLHTFLRGLEKDGASDDWLCSITEMKPRDEMDGIDPTIAEVAALQPTDAEIIAAATRDAIEHGVLTGLKGIPILKPGEEIELISVEGGKSYNIGTLALGLKLKAVRWYNDKGDHVGTELTSGNIVTAPAGVSGARMVLPGQPEAIIGARDIVELLSPVSGPQWDKVETCVSHMRGAISSLLHQVGQMRGMFTDEDGTIQDAVESGEEALEEAEALLDVAQPVAAAVLDRLGKVAAQLAEREPLPTALAMIDHIINMGGEAGNYGRYAKRALAEIVSAGTELHSSLGEALETHIYDTTNGDEIEPDCGYVKAMEAWAEAMAGSPMSYALPAAPLPWRCVHTTKSIALVGANDCGTGIAIDNPTDEQIRNVLALLAAVNAQPVVEVMPEVAVILEGGMVQHVCTRNAGPVIVNIVDYDAEEADPANVTEIPQDGGGTADAIVSRYTPAGLDRTATAPFWLTLAGE